MTTTQRTDQEVTIDRLKEHVAENGSYVPSTMFANVELHELVDSGHLHKVNNLNYFARKTPSSGKPTKAEFVESYWEYLASMMEYKFGEQWAISPEHSVLWHLGEKTPPNKIRIIATGSSHSRFNIGFGFTGQPVDASPREGCVMLEKNGLRVHTPEASIASVQKIFFSPNIDSIKKLAKTVKNADKIAAAIQQHSHVLGFGPRTVKLLNEAGNTTTATKLEALLNKSK